MFSTHATPQAGARRTRLARLALALAAATTVLLAGTPAYAASGPTASGWYYDAGGSPIPRPAAQTCTGRVTIAVGGNGDPVHAELCLDKTGARQAQATVHIHNDSTSRMKAVATVQIHVLDSDDRLTNANTYTCELLLIAVTGFYCAGYNYVGPTNTGLKAYATGTASVNGHGQPFQTGWLTIS